MFGVNPDVQRYLGVGASHCVGLYTSSNKYHIFTSLSILRPSLYNTHIHVGHTGCTK